jgi:DNA-binding Lrp family transcriptional regulator
VQNVHHLAADVEARIMDALDRTILRRLQQDGRSRETIESVRDSVARMPETLGVFVVTGNEDILIHVAVPDTPYLRDFVLDQLARRKEIVDVRTTVVYEHIRPVEQSELPVPR